MAFTSLSWWLWGSGKDDEPAAPPSPLLSSSSDFGLGFREPESVKLPSVKGGKMQSSSRSRQKWHSQEEGRIDPEYDIVLVPPDGACMSGWESDDSDWSIGWTEPHAPDFLNDCETERSFAVLVRCYGREQVESPKRHILGAVNSLNDYSFDGKNYIEQWLSSPNM